MCPQPGCANDQPCPDHTPKPWASSDRAARLPRNWSTIRARIIRRDGATCQACYGMRCGSVRLEVDHIVNNDDHSDANLRTLGHECHAAKTQAEAQAGRVK